LIYKYKQLYTNQELIHRQHRKIAFLVRGHSTSENNERIVTCNNTIQHAIFHLMECKYFYLFTEIFLHGFDAVGYVIEYLAAKKTCYTNPKGLLLGNLAKLGCISRKHCQSNKN